MIFRPSIILCVASLALVIACTNPCHVDSPRIITHPQSQTVLEGESVTFKMVDADPLEPVKFQWQKNGVDIVPLRFERSDLVINPISLSDAGSYTAIVTYYRSGDCSTNKSTTSAPAILTVNPKPIAPLLRSKTEIGW